MIVKDRHFVGNVIVKEAQIFSSSQAKDDVDDDDDEDKDADDDEEKGPGENRRDSIASEASDTTVSIQLSHDGVTSFKILKHPFLASNAICDESLFRDIFIGQQRCESKYPMQRHPFIFHTLCYACTVPAMHC